MSKLNEQITKERLLESAWLWSSILFIAIYSVSTVKGLLGMSTGRRVLHIICCFCLMVTYGSCVFFKTSAVNIQKLLKDSNFRCLLVACSLLGMKGATIPMLPFFIMSSLSVAGYIAKNKKTWENTGILRTAVMLSRKRDELTLLAYKIEILSVPLLLVHLVFGNSDLFVVASYMSMTWHEYNTNLCMRRAVVEIITTMDTLMRSSNVPEVVNQRYTQFKGYISSRIPLPVDTKTKTQ
ncbi:hypothetical protein NEOKW01_0731 [Nematocida sp. AWRm80]|nr:hypothetical protein NEOKW01_0731 [Nematocida sp. AWRm80]